MKEIKRRKRTKHDMVASPEYKAFYSAMSRCNNPNRSSYKRYGGRGIEFRFDSWLEFWEELGARPSNLHTLDRINPDGHYEKGNVRWATRKEQANNRTNNKRYKHQGLQMTLTEWSKHLNIKLGTLYTRKMRGWTGKRLFSKNDNRYGN